MSEDQKDSKLEYLMRMNERVYEQLSYAETKNGILLGLLAAIIGVMVGVLVGDARILYGLKIYLVILTVCFSVSLISCLLSFFPNCKVLKNSPNPNIYFYGSLAKFETANEYNENIRKMHEHEEDLHLEAQNIQVSRIIVRKHKYFTVAIHFIFASLVLPIYIGYILCGHIVKRKKFKS